MLGDDQPEENEYDIIQDVDEQDAVRGDNNNVQQPVEVEELSQQVILDFIEN